MASRFSFPRRLPGLLAAVLALWAGTVSPGRADDPPEVQDLAYGEVLFRFYQQDPFGAISRLLVALERDSLSHHRDEAELLLGGLELSWGMWREAETVFSRLLDRPEVESSVRDRAWYQLARIAHRKGDDEVALQALGRMSERPRLRLRAERELLAASLLVRLGRPREAVDRLRAWHGPDDLEPYARFNLAAALLAAGEDKEAEKKLEFLGRARARSEEARSLRDKANLALGIRHLEAGRVKKAQRVLERIRLQGPFAAQGLLAVGWARAEADDFRGALVPWLELRRRDPFDPSVLEALLSVPYAYARLGVYGKAAALYEEGIAIYRQEAGRLQEAMSAVQQGKLAEALARQDRGGSSLVPEFDPVRVPGGRYLARLLASHGFREAWRNFRDLQQMQGQLAAWQGNLEVLGTMLETRRAGYARSLPAARDMLRKTDLERLAGKRDALAARLEAIAEAGDAQALFTGEEADQWQRLDALERRLNRLQDAAERPAMQDRLRRLRGLLLWQAYTEFPDRLWGVRKSLKTLDEALVALADRRAAMERAVAAAPAGFDAYRARIGALRSRIGGAQRRLATVLERQRAELEAMALAELKRRQQRLEQYLMQSRFALAQLYDRAAASGKPRRKGAGR